MTFEFKRRINFYLLSWYLPATLIVVLSWVGFWIDIKSTPARISLGTITILAIGGFLIGEQEGFPSVSYVRAIDIYLIACFVFVFGCMVEYAIVHCAKRLEEESEQQKKKGNKVIVSLWIVIGQNDLFNLDFWIQKNVKMVMLWQRELDEWPLASSARGYEFSQHRMSATFMSQQTDFTVDRLF